MRNYKLNKITMKHLFQFLSILLLVALAACTNEDNGLVVDEGEEDVARAFELTQAESRAAADVLSFNQDFFKAVVASEKPKGNVVCSPLSASVLLSMVANSAEGDLRSEITKALGCNDLEALNSLSQKYLLALPDVDKAVTFTSANSVWYSQEYTIAPEFESVTKKYYDAPNFGRNFGNAPAVVKEINDWCNDKTNGIIDKMLNTLPEGAVAVLANAIYFKGMWPIPFDKSQTEDMPFYGVNGTSTVKMMHKLAFQDYLKTEQFDAAKMQIGSGKFEAFLIQPKTDLDAFISTTNFDQILSAEYDAGYIHYYMPRFKYQPEAPIELEKPLLKLGISSINKGNNLVMFTKNFDVTFTVIQKIGAEFTEEGAEGASVTLGEVVYTNWGSEPEEPATLKFDHPFVFMIRETTTGALLFAGKISDL